MSTRHSPPPLTLNDLDLLFRISNQLRKHLDRGFDTDHDLTYDQAQVLWHIAVNEGDCRPSTATGLDEALALATPAKHHVATLARKGLIEEDTESHWRDRRRKPLRLTRQGQTAVEQFAFGWQLIANQAFATGERLALQRLSVALRDLWELPEALHKTFVSGDNGVR